MLKKMEMEIENETLEVLFPCTLRLLSCNRDQIDVTHDFDFEVALRNAQNDCGELWFQFSQKGSSVVCIAVYEFGSTRYHWTRDNGQWVAGFCFATV